mmetsp:Transcript_63693/g.175859  ORF Transcript_63693/g.175859 Transcript_63693/m.175859 type:complete len:275 (-) Transcript_63693:3352-4176(-)
MINPRRYGLSWCMIFVACIVLACRHAYGTMYVIEGMERSERDFKEAYTRMCEDNTELKQLEMVGGKEPDPVVRDAFTATMHSLAAGSLSATNYVRSATTLFSSAPKVAENTPEVAEQKPDAGHPWDRKPVVDELLSTTGNDGFNFNEHSSFNENSTRLEMLGSTNAAAKATTRTVRNMYRGTDIKKHAEGVGPYPVRVPKGTFVKQPGSLGLNQGRGFDSDMAKVNIIIGFGTVLGCSLMFVDSNSSSLNCLQPTIASWHSTVVQRVVSLAPTF